MLERGPTLKQRWVNVVCAGITSFIHKPFQRGGRLYTSESDVYRQIVTYEDSPALKQLKYV